MAIWAAVIVGREIAVSALREWMAELGQRATVKVAALGKIKTIVQMVALSCLLYASTPGSQALADIWMGRWVFVLGDWLLAIAALLTLWSGIQYLIAAWPILRDGEKKTVDSSEQAATISPLTTRE